MRPPNFKMLLTLVRRELAEHRLLFLGVPIASTVLAIVTFTLWLFRISGPPESLMRYLERGPVVRPGTSPEFAEYILERARESVEDWYGPVVPRMFSSTASLMLLVFWSSMAFYYLYTLYQQRKNRSILFWNSMPVSDSQTVTSKLLAGLVACHLVYMLCFAVLDLWMYVTIPLHVKLNEVVGFAPYLREASPFAFVFSYLLAMPLSILWTLPVYGWLLLASAWSRQAPFGWAVGPWLLVVVVEVALTEKSVLFSKIVEHALPLPFPELALNEQGFQTPELVLSAVLGATFLFAAARFNRPDES